MCSGPKSKLCSSKTLMEGGEFRMQKDESLYCNLALLEFAACDDLSTFRREIEEKGLDVNQPSFWYCRGIGSKKMGFEERTPLMVAAMYGSTEVLKYIISSGKADMNRVCGDDKVTALHCAVAGCAGSMVEVIKFMLDASAVPNCVDSNGNKPVDLIARSSRFMTSPKRRAVEFLLKGGGSLVDEVLSLEKEGDEQKVLNSQTSKYPVDASLPDINEGIYGTDEFRMYTFKVKPCSRAYSHDWTECPFVHPGENARRRDPRKYPYTCVPCPEFRKGSCPKVDACEYAHGVFESWLHPAQYRTRLCKDETGCARKVCFFAHKPEELRPVNASTGSAVLSPRSSGAQPSVSSMDMAVMSPLTLGSPGLAFSSGVSTAPISPLNSPALAYSSGVSTAPISPLSSSVSSSPRNGGFWQNRVNNVSGNLTPPALQLPSSRLKSALNARDLDMEMEMRLLGLNNQNGQMGFGRLGDLKPSNLEDKFGSFDSSSSMLSPLHGLSSATPTQTQLQSPNRLPQINHYPSSPLRKPQQSFGFDTSAAVAAAVMNSRSSAFAKRSLSFKPTAAPSNLSDWGSPTGKLDWGIHGDELNKLRRSVSFGIRNSDNNMGSSITARDYAFDEPDVSWVNSLVKDGAPENRNSPAARGRLPPWAAEQMYIEHEQIMA